MDRDLMKKWVKALRSGKYKQGKQVLQNAKGEFCCLGVLADILGQETRGSEASCVITYEFPKELECFDTWPLQGGFGNPRIKLTSKEEYDLNKRSKFNNFWRAATLADLNDNNFTFKRIADIIERNADTI